MKIENKGKPAKMRNKKNKKRKQRFLKPFLFEMNCFCFQSNFKKFKVTTLLTNKYLKKFFL
jgi:hypothetical protein